MQDMDKSIIYKDDKLIVRRMTVNDVSEICKAENDESDSFIVYLKKQIQHQEDGLCTALLAVYEEKIAGYVYLYYHCKWGGLANQSYPGIVDLFVMDDYRSKGIGNTLMSVAENIAKQYANQVYLDVGLCSSFGSAHRLYAKRGYIPDGKGVYYDDKVCETNAVCKNNDDLTLCLIKELL